MFNTKQFKSQFATLVTVSLLTLSTSSMAEETVQDIVSWCQGSGGQLCDPPWPVDVTTDGTLQLNYTIAPSHCSSIRLNISVDGGPATTTSYLGWNGDPDGQPLETGLIDLGPVSAGQHQISLQAEGKEGGCNAGSLGSWGGTLHVFSSGQGTLPKAYIGGTVTGMNAEKGGTVSCQNLTTKQKVKVHLPKGVDVRNWDCSGLGLAAKSGDKIKQTVTFTGIAD